MKRKTSFALVLLIGIVLSASCSPTSTDATPAPGLPNPASVYCQQNGGMLEFVTDASGGLAGVCFFADASKCDEWAYFRNECKPGDSLKPAPASPAPTE